MRSVIESAHQYGTDSRSDAGQFALQIVVQSIVSIESAISYVSSSNYPSPVAAASSCCTEDSVLTFDGHTCAHMLRGE
jgi:hypothetical protein